MSEATPGTTDGKSATFHLPVVEEQVEGLPPGFGEGLAGKAAFLIAVAFSVFQIYIAAYGSLPSQVVRAMHVGFLLLLGFGLIANLRATGAAAKAAFWTLGALGFATGLYNWVFYADLIRRSGFLTTPDLIVGALLVALVFEAARRLMGLPLAVIAFVFLAYCFVGNHLPPPFIHRGYDFAQLVDTFAYGTEGIYGTPVYVSAAYIFIFVVFAAFLERAGMIALFNDFALGLVGSWRGGPAQVCVLSSALMGTISGSGVANVVASGQFTIPLMKRFGFRSAFAGAVEATSSMGGQIMPPVMGAVAFIMAETLNIPYAEVVKAAIIPALFYFGACFWQVHLEAGKAGLHGMAKAELPNPWEAVRKHWPLVLPLAVLVYLLFAGYTPIFAGTMGLALTVVLILGTPLAASIGPFAFRVVFWLALGLAAASFMRFGVNVLGLVIAVLIVACFTFKGGRETLRICVDSLAEGAKNALPVGIACAIVGIVIGTLTLTGIASTFIGWIISIGENNLFLSLVLTMLTCLVLGMGIPTIPNYIITSSLAGPALLSLGVPLIVSHMFVFYFGIMADLTPPVALAAFAAAPMARESGLKIGIQATKLAIAGFVVPFMAVYTPALMLQDAGPIAAQFGYPVEVAYIVVKACMGIVLWGAAAVGFLARRMAWWERLVAFAAGVLLVAALPLTDEAGWALALLWIGWHCWRARLASTASPI
ncbi:TRAP transporter permease [Mesorhizobium sp. M1C.F.Ca.ET.193.01.1.1]|uniref:TRAP transporter permease n=2 Tax=Mesorhizobium TaxID=68287 RepID=UPI000FD4A721|nr:MULTISPECIES: TRAP transporter permease [unclassified Mesorhizobium]TGS95117.1 TRAP transporter permease [bacterium M00.F.Ca.ET.177.01.1.1]TGQ51452.1 TRAP transporter permease [Mesorhizobium sp. M1C.F.Ca.ET.210.01.1.1]TGQ67246.1 TRAP transporter permease [Mesorhizobium sp. M1C.F.Ca.ET.212.01.1.1]TGR02128.1 TRAP transporter permease [Mesorhizobium sp. M1C.F.Ca.ET.204.01.1.1]TGR22818.1 TRAP transporter permease [Mesorhizobium sp. M1C.F.Ca.ET.196.01.1.1]